jgi:hypothetical protein
MLFSGLDKNVLQFAYYNYICNHTHFHVPTLNEAVFMPLYNGNIKGQISNIAASGCLTLV